MSNTNTPPDWAQYWTCDQVAECLPYQRHLPADYDGDLYSRLWELASLADTPTPQGGDGSNGTVETPCGRMGNYDDKLGSVWNLLTPVEQKAIVTAKEME